MKKNKLVKSVEMACLTVSDVKRAKHFFCDILGLELTEDAPEYSWMEFKSDQGACIGVGQPHFEGMKAGVNAKISFTVEDIKAAKAHLEKNGVKVGNIQEIPDQVKIADFKDEDGNCYFIAEKL